MHNKNIAKAIYTYQASKAYNIDSKLLTTLINSESSYKANAKHSLDHVSGLAGINKKYWDVPNKSIKEQIFAGAYVLRHYLNRYKGDTLKALIAYKGISDLGRRQAKDVYNRYLKIS
jgi:soluble lytic murein transglycosylase-like protein